jgi:putative oxidoreductase
MGVRIIVVKFAGMDERTAPIAHCSLRLGLGILFILHLYYKFFVLPIGFYGWWATFAQNGYPWFIPYYVFSAELVGALLLIPGIYARWAALYTAPMMIAAAQFWLVRKGFYFTAAGGELPCVWSVLLLLFALLGDGPYAAVASPAFGHARAIRV